MRKESPPAAAIPPPTDTQARIAAGVEMIKAALAEAYPGRALGAEVFFRANAAGVAIAAHDVPGFKLRLGIYWDTRLRHGVPRHKRIAAGSRRTARSDSVRATHGP